MVCYKRNKYVSLPQSVVNFPYSKSWGRRRSSGTLTNIYARQIPSNFSFLFSFWWEELPVLRWLGNKNSECAVLSRYYRNIIYGDNYNKSNNKQAQLDHMPNHDMNFIPRMYVGTSLIDCLKDVKLRSCHSSCALLTCVLQEYSFGYRPGIQLC